MECEPVYASVTLVAPLLTESNAIAFGGMQLDMALALISEQLL